MVFILVLLQILIPLGLVAWMFFFPAKNRAGFWLQLVGTGLALLMMKTVFMWLHLPWWLADFYLLLWALTVLKQFLRRGIRFEHSWPGSAGACISTSLMLLITLGSAFLLWQGLQGRQPPDTRVVDIPFPMGSGTYLLVNGGSDPVINPHMATLNPEIERFRAYRGQSYALDIVKINRFGFRAEGILPSSLNAYEIYGEAVLAPCTGEITGSRNNRPDMPVPEMDTELIEGNFVLLRCDDFELLFAHLQPGSVTVNAGDMVSSGEQLGLVGNSGQTNEPHLHLHAQRPATEAGLLSGEPLGISFDGSFPVRNSRITIN
ncbi:MAG: peptidase M23 [Gammaproteobacteria bacterium]|nr:peptidase M23 [Gammaproteobacteria bacterium]|tara:strand:+ start:98957 stop:99910 length:954 start_codon:yes stop_codon:yes gene_type:complete